MAALASIITGIVLSVSTGDSLLVEDRIFGSFQHATRIDFDIRGRCFVIDRGSNSLAVFSPQLDLTVSLGGFGWDLAAFDGPSGIASDGLSTFVADHGNHRVILYDQSMSAISTLMTRDSSFASARFGFPLGVALSPHGELYVLDGENNRVVKFDPRMRFERSFGGIEAGVGRLRQPIDILTGARGQVMVLEPGRIVEFDYAGNYVRRIGEGVLTNARGFGVMNFGIVVVDSAELRFFNEGGDVSDQLHEPLIIREGGEEVVDVAVHDDRMFLLTTKRVQVFRFAGGGR